jgi:NADH dehydrogenase
MYKKRIIIIGGGFAGLSAAQYLSRHKRHVETWLVDQRENNLFRPLIPDAAGGRIPSHNLLYPFLAFKEKYGFNFHCEQVNEIDFSRNEVVLSEKRVAYDYLILATGSQTSIPHSGPYRQFALKLDSIYNADYIRNAVKSGTYDRFVVCGGGYTGIELASNLHNFIKKSGLSTEVIIVELMDKLLGTLPQWMSTYVTRALTDLGVQIRLSTSVNDLSENEVILSNSEHLKKTLCIWTAGLEASSLSRNINADKVQKGRIVVNNYLFFRDNCLAAGDAACCKQNNECSRMSVQCSIDQGRIAAANAIADNRKVPLKKYIMWDPGFIIPMAEGKACGEIFGIPVKDRTAMLFHYLLSSYRATGVSNRFNIARATLKAV